jgi:hypothetical protein
LNKAKSVVKEGLLSFWFFSVLAIFLCVFFAVFQYRSMFGGGLANTSIEFANFGAYIGGVFGPLVSFVTLLAVLKTVYLQRELLTVQKDEFRSLLVLQGDAALKQDKQILLAKVEAERSKVESYQSTILNLIETFSSQFRREADGMADTIHKIISSGTTSQNIKNIEILMERKRLAEGKVHELLLLAFEVSVKEYEDIKEIRSVFGPAISKILLGDS